MTGCCCGSVCAEALKKVKNFDRRKQETGSPSCSQCRRQQHGGEIGGKTGGKVGQGDGRGWQVQDIFMR